jgi:hypothetical protein
MLYSNQVGYTLNQVRLKRRSVDIFSNYFLRK